MGYELSLEANSVEEANRVCDVRPAWLGKDSALLWFCCGWDKVELFRMLSRYGDIVEDGYKCRIHLNDLAFLSEIRENVCKSADWDKARKLQRLDEFRFWDWYVSLEPERKADMEIAFVVNHDYELESELLEMSENAQLEVVLSLIEVIDKSREAGIDALWMYGG